MVELTLADLRKMGGQALLKKYGKEHFSKLGKLGAEKKKELKAKEAIVEVLKEPVEPQI